MAKAIVQWLKDGIFIGTDSTNHSVVLSTDRSGERVGMKPSELILVALAGCTAVDIVNILEKKRMPLEALEIHIEGEQDSEPPWTYKKIHVTYRLKGRDLTDKAVKQAIEISDTKYCSVSASLRNHVEVEHDYEILGDEDDS